MKKINVFVYIAFGLAVLGVLLSIYYCCIVIDYWGGWCNVSCNVISRNVLLQLKDNIGDFLWGTLGVLYTLTTTIFLFVTFYNQKKQIIDAKKEANRARFETTYFNLLGMLKQVQDNVNANISSNMTGLGVKDMAAYYKRFKKEYDSHMTSDESLKSIMDSFYSKEINVAYKEQLSGVLAKEFETYVDSTQCHVSFFYRYIYNAIKFVVDYTHSESERTIYLNLLQAQLSNEELALLFYDAISKYGQDKENRYRFKDMLNETNFLDNIDDKFLLDRRHCILYSKTTFRFLNRDELVKVLAERNS